MKRGMLLAAVLALLGCGSTAVAAETLAIPGTGACEVLLRNLAAAFNARNAGTEVRVPPSVSSGGGIRMVAAGESLLGRIARPAGEQEPVSGLRYLPFARDVIIFGAGAGVTVRSLTSAQLVAILQGKISHWQDVGGEKAVIRLLVRQPGDVILTTVQRYLNLGDSAFAPEAKIVHHDLEMTALLQKYKNSLGMLSRSSIYGIKAGINPLAVDEVTPTTANVAAGKYKFAVEYGLVYKDPLNELAKTFIDFIFSPDGKAIMTRHGVIPLEQH